jgi:hypothetical protein
LAFDFEEVLFLAGLAFAFEEALFFAGFLFLVPPMKSSLYARGYGLGSGKFPDNTGAAYFIKSCLEIKGVLLLNIGK